MLKRIVVLFLLTIGWGSVSAQRNVILIIADDLGSDYCGFQENHLDTVSLPNVRKLLSRGVRFSNVWSNPLCSPTRAGMLTGRYSFRTGVGNVITNPASAQLDTAEITIPKLLKNSNAPTKYATASIGKWHLQVQNNQTVSFPNKMGYDRYAGCFVAEVADYYNWTKVTDGVVSNSRTYATVEATNDAISWMSQQKIKPFFLWMAYNAPHFPYHLPPDSLISNHKLSGTAANIAANTKPYFKAMNEVMDNEIGRLFKWLETNNKLDNTDIIFIGDNGDEKSVAQIANLNRIKGSVYQHGVSVPMIIAGPSVKNPGRSSDALVNLQDLFATIIELTGYTNWRSQIPANKPVDSKSLVPILSNQTTQVRPWAFTEVFGTATTSDGKAIRNQDYKLFTFDNGKKEFYNLTKDPEELTDLLSTTIASADVTNYNYLCAEMSTLTGKNSLCSLVLGLNHQTPSSLISYPNPFTSRITLSTENKKDEVDLINSAGQLIYTGKDIESQDFSMLPTGVYFLKVVSNATNVFKLIKE